MTNNLKAKPFSIVKKILGASLNHLLEEGNYSLQETRGKLSRDVSLCRHTSLAFSAIYTEYFFFIPFGKCLHCFSYTLLFSRRKRGSTDLSVGFETEPLLKYCINQFYQQMCTLL